MSSTFRRNLALSVITAPAGVFIVQWIGITFFGWAALPWPRFALVSFGAYAIVVLVNLLEHGTHLFGSIKNEDVRIWLVGITHGTVLLAFMALAVFFWKATS